MTADTQPASRDVKKIDGPRIAARSGTARRLVVILHGYGADGNDLIDLARTWQDLLPDADFVAPHAHEPCAMAPMGRQWFALTDRSAQQRWNGACSARSVIDAFLDAELAARGLDESALAIVGFSQGAMMTLHAGLRRPRAPACLLAYSGLLVGPEHIGETTSVAQKSAPPPVLLCHGHMDEVVPFDAMFSAAQQMADAGVPTQWHLAIGLGHGIDPEGLRIGGAFLKESFKSADRARARAASA